MQAVICLKHRFKEYVWFQISLVVQKNKDTSILFKAQKKLSVFFCQWLDFPLYSVVLQQSHLWPCYVSAVAALTFSGVFIFLKSSWFWSKGKVGILVPQKPWSFPLGLWGFGVLEGLPGRRETPFILGLVSWDGRIQAFWGSLEIIWERSLAWQLGLEGCCCLTKRHSFLFTASFTMLVQTWSWPGVEQGALQRLF